MKKTVLYIFGFSFIVLFMYSCGSSKNGCGLTTDAHKIEQTTAINSSTVRP